MKAKSFLFVPSIFPERFTKALQSGASQIIIDLEDSVEVAKKIIKKEVELSNDVLKNIINEVLGELSNTDEKITIKVAHDDVDFARASLPEIIQANKIEAKVAITPDESIEKGSCMVVSSNGVVDANFSTQLQIIQNAFGIYNGGQ